MANNTSSGTTEGLLSQSNLPKEFYPKYSELIEKECAELNKSVKQGKAYHSCIEKSFQNYAIDYCVIRPNEDLPFCLKIKAKYSVNERIVEAMRKMNHQNQQIFGGDLNKKQIEKACLKATGKYIDDCNQRIFQQQIFNHCSRPFMEFTSFCQQNFKLEALKVKGKQQTVKVAN